MNRLKNLNVGRKATEEARKNMSIASKKRPISKKCFNAMKVRNSKKIIDTSTGIIYDSITDLCKKLNLKRTTINAKLSGQTNNNTFFKYYK